MGIPPASSGMSATSRLECPYSIRAKLLDELYDKPAMELPRKMMHSPGEPMVIKSNDFGPFQGQMLVPDENGRRIVRLMPEEVDNAWQGAATLFYENAKLRAGGVRIAPSPDGKSIYYGSTTRGWQRPDEGIQRITYNGKAPFHVQSCSLTSMGSMLALPSPSQSLIISPSVLKSAATGLNMDTGMAPENWIRKTIKFLGFKKGELRQLNLGTFSGKPGTRKNLRIILYGKIRKWFGNEESICAIYRPTIERPSSDYRAMISKTQRVLKLAWEVNLSPPTTILPQTNQLSGR